MWKTGHSFIKAKIKETGALLAGEMSGHIFIKERWYGFDDALYAGARLLEILGKDERPSAEVFADLPDSINTPELNVQMQEGEPPVFIDRLMESAHFNGATISTIDGLRADYEDGWGHGIVVNNAFAEDIIIRNNICSQNNSQIGIEDYLSNIIVDHNLIDGINNAPESVFGQDSIIGEALFVDALSFNFHLLNNSPAIDNGSLVDAPIKDFDNYYRPYGEGVDIGAFEYNPASAVSSSYSLLENIQVFPNPFSEGITVTIHDGKIQEYDIRMYNNLGALVKTYKVHTLFSQSFTIETKNLVLGLYIVDIESNNKESTRVKLFKE